MYGENLQMKLETIINSTKCYGCGACVCSCNFGALKMGSNGQGFMYPILEQSKCKNCNSCYKVCPAVDDNLNKIRGAVKIGDVYSARNVDSEIRRKSSSGGVFYALSEYVLQNNGYVCGVVWNNDFTVRHILSNMRIDRDAMIQSKYIQSDMNSCYKDVKKKLEDGRSVLFTGTPCQCAALKIFLRNVKTDNLVLCDVLCGGNVSPGFFKSYLNYIEKCKNDKTQGVCFRTKKLGWKQHHIRVTLNHSIYEGARRDNEPFFSLYLAKNIIRVSCFECAFASKERITDITLGDFWGIVDKSIDDDIGISFIEVNTNKGAEILKNISDQLLTERRDINLAASKQINLRTAPIKPKNYDEFWNCYVRNGGEYTLKKYSVFGLRKRIKMKLLKIAKVIKIKSGMLCQNARGSQK